MSEEKEGQTDLTPMDDPVLEGIAMLDTSFKASTKAMDGRVSAAEKQQKGDVERLEKQTAQSHETIMEHMKALERRASVEGRFGQAPVDALVSAIPENQRHVISEVKAVCTDGTVNHLTGKVNENRLHPATQAAMALWWKNALVGQMASRFPERCRAAQDEVERLGTALNDFTGVTKAELEEGADSAGGYLVPDIIRGEILRIALDSSVVFSRARQIPMTSNRLEIPNEATGISVAWIAEKSTITASEPVLGVNILTAKKLAARAVVSTELAEDSLVAVFPYLQTIFGEAIGRELDQEALEGDGTNLSGVESESARNTTGNVTGTTIVYSDLPATMYGAGEQSTRLGAAWFMSPAIFSTIVALTDSNGMPIVQFANVQNSPFPNLLGAPVYLTNVLNVAKTVGGDPNNGSVYHGDPQTLLFGMNRSLRFGVSEHVLWTTDRLDFKITQRVGFTVANPGAWTELQGVTKLGG